MTALFLWFLVGLALSAFFSGVEMAFVSSDRVKIREKADSGDKSAKRISRFYKEPQYFLTTVLIGNNLANITTTALFTYIMSKAFGVSSEWVVAAVLTPVLLICAEILPKEYCRNRSHAVLLNASAALEWIGRSLNLLSRALMTGVEFFLKPLAGNKTKSIFVSEQEFRYLIEESTKTGVVSHHEKKIIDTILDFESTRTRAVMTPVDKVPKVELRSRVGDVKKTARETGARMLLVYEEIPSIVVGMVYVFDLLFEEDDNKKLGSFLRSPVFIRETTSCEMAFFTLQKRRQSYAVVVDNKQEVTGAVSIEKLLIL